MSQAPVIIVGWDGATWDRIDPLLAAGRLPTLARLLPHAARGVLRSTVPPVTPAAWTAMATGCNPGRTGVLGFRHHDLRRLSGYSPRLASGEDLRGRTLYEHAGACGLGVSLVAHPMTWPPFPIPGGALLAGWPRPETTQAPVWPAELGEALSPWSAGSAGPADAERTRDGARDPVRAARELDERTHAVALRWQAEREDPLMFVGLQGTDHLAHRFWAQPELDDAYVRCDLWLGELLETRPQARVLLVSDHGFGAGPTGRVHLGRALAQAGLAQLGEGGHSGQDGLLRRARSGLSGARWKAVRDHLPERLRTWGFERGGARPGTARVARVALYEGWEGLVVQVRGRQRGGPVAPSDYLSVRDEAARCVGALSDRQGPLAVEVLSREQIWSGPRLAEMPDLVVRLRDDLTAGDGRGRGPISEPRDRPRGEGSHRPEGVFVAVGDGVVPGSVSEVAPWDVLPTALALLGLGTAAQADGRAREDLLVRPPPPPIPRRAVPGAPWEGARGGAQLRESLRRLGYL